MVAAGGVKSLVPHWATHRRGPISVDHFRTCDCCALSLYVPKGPACLIHVELHMRQLLHTLNVVRDHLSVRRIAAPRAKAVIARSDRSNE